MQSVARWGLGWAVDLPHHSHPFGRVPNHSSRLSARHKGRTCSYINEKITFNGYLDIKPLAAITQVFFPHIRIHLQVLIQYMVGWCPVVMWRPTKNVIPRPVHCSRTRTIDPICESFIVRKFLHLSDSRLEERQLPVRFKETFTFYDFFILLVHAVILRCRNSYNVILLAIG